MNWSIIPASWSGILLSVLRIVAGLLFFAHGVQKHLNFPPGDGPPAGLGAIAGWFELIFGALIVLGLLTRVSAFLMSGMMAIAYWMVHAPQDALPILNNGESAILFCFVFLYIAAAGPGPWSIDAIRSRVA